MFPEDTPDERFQKSHLGFEVGMAPWQEDFPHAFESLIKQNCIFDCLHNTLFTPPISV